MIDLQSVYDQLYKPLTNFAVSFCYDVNMAHNVVANVFSILAEKDEMPVDLRGWLFTATKHEAIDYYNQTKRFDCLEYVQDMSDSLDLRPTEEEALEKIDYEERILKILPVLERLTPRQRRALHLRLLENRSTLETGIAMGITEEQAKTIFRSSILKIRKPLGVSTVGQRKVGICSYGACKNKSVSRVGFCKKHLRIKQATWVRRNDRKKNGWS